MGEATSWSVRIIESYPSFCFAGDWIEGFEAAIRAMWTQPRASAGRIRFSRPLAANLQVAVRQHQANDEFGAFDQIGLPSLDGLGL